MKGKRIISVLLSLALLPAIGMMNVSAASGETIRLNPADASPFNDGEFQGWGTALCWWANRIGYSTKMTQQAADLFFSDEGLGLDIARYNLGGGDNPEHNHINRSDSKVPGVWETFKLSEDGKDVENITYDITNDQNQLNIAKAALAANPNLYFEGFSNSAPYFMTVTGCTSGGVRSLNSKGEPYSNENNLKDDMYDDFGKFIADATKLFKDNGIVFQSYSPMNEPDTGYWFEESGKQEGCHFDPGTSQSKAIIETRKALDEAGLTDVLVAGMDETSLKSTANNLGKLTDEAKTSLGRIDTHTYSDRGYHAQVKAKAVEMNKNLWQSEVDKGGDGFTLASMIIEDMNGMQPSAWVMWDIIDVHKDSNFVDPTTGNKTEANNSITDTSSVWGVGMADHDAEEIKLTNKYYAYGQFTKYIEPGMTIISSSNSTLAAYDKNTGKIVIVALNYDAKNKTDKNVTFDLRAFSKTGSKAKVIRTNASSEKWAPQSDIDVTNKQFNATLKADTITTYVIEGDGTPVNYMTISGSNTIVAGFDYTFGIGGSDLSFIEGSINWSVSDPDMADITVDTVSNTATVNAKKGGTFTLTVAAGDVNTSIDVNVLADGQTLKIVNKKSGLGLETKSKAINSGSQLVQWENRNLDTAAWTLAATEDGHFNIINKNADMLLASNADAKPVISKDIAAADNAAKWDLINHGGYFEIKNVSIGKSLNVSGQSTANGGSVILYDFGGGDNELWALSEVTGDLEHVVPVPVDYSEKYNGTQYSFIKNIEAATNDFSEEAKGFVMSGEAKLGSDSDGEAVLFPQGTLNNKNNVNNAGTAALTLETPLDGEDNQIINLSFDMYTPESDGSSTFDLTSSNGSEIVKIVGTDYGKKYSVIIGSETVEENGDGQTYFKNNQGNKDSSIHINRGGHVEIYYTPSTGDVTVTVKNVTNTAAMKTYTGTTKAKDISKIYFAGEYTAWNKQMAVGNLVTNIIEKGLEAWEKAKIKATDIQGKDVTAEYEIKSGVRLENAALIGALYSVSGQLAEVKSKNIANPNSGSETLTFDKNVENYDLKLMLWQSIDGDGAMVPLCNTSLKAATAPLETIAPTSTPTVTEAPVLPDSGELISLNFDNGDLTSGSTYGKASGTAKFAEVDGKKCVQFDNTNTNVLTLTDANGNGLLAGIEEFTVSFLVKPTEGTKASWWFYSAPNDNAQASPENYIGVFRKPDGKTLSVERYKNGRSDTTDDGNFTLNEWHNVVISFSKGDTTLYVDGVLKDSDTSAFAVSDMLGSNPVAYIGKANWGSGEYATGYVDDFVIYNHAVENPLSSLDLGDLSAVTADITIPTVDGVTWETSDASVVALDGKVTRADDTKKAVLTAKTVKDGIAFTKSFNVTVPGYTAVLDTFAAYVEGNAIKYTSGYVAENEKYAMYVYLSHDDTMDRKEAASGEFTGLAWNDTYTISCVLTNKDSGETVKSVRKHFTINAEENMEAYLFVHFVGNESTDKMEQIYFSVSQNGTDWQLLNGGNPVLTSTVGENGVRDPYILRGEDGKFRIIATDLSINKLNGTQGSNKWSYSQTNGSKNIVVWESDNLVDWGEPNLRKVALDTAGCTWAPEAVYDNEKQQYMVFWASKISDDNYAKQRIYRSYTSDFVNFTEPEVYIDNPNSTIDTTIISDKGVYYRFTKDESHSAINMMKSNSLSGTWTEIDSFTIDGKAGTSYTGYEGPTIYKMNGENKWCYLIDLYSGNKGYFPFVTEDLASGAFTSTTFNFPSGVTYRHGTVMPITKAEYRRLVNKYSDTKIVADPADMDSSANNHAMVVDEIVKSAGSGDKGIIYQIKGYTGGAQTTITLPETAALAELTGYDVNSNKYKTSDVLWTYSSAENLSKYLHKGDIIISDGESVLRYSSARDAYKKLKASESVAKTIQSTQTRNNFYLDAVKSADINENDSAVLEINSFRISVDPAKVMDTVTFDMSKTIDTENASDADWDTVIGIDKDGSTITDLTAYNADTLGDYAFIRIADKGQLQEIIVYRFTK